VHVEYRGQGSFARWVHKVLPVKRSEVLTVSLLALNCFVLLTCYYVLKVVREPLILLGGGAELKAYASGGQTLLLLAIVPAFSLLSRRVSRIRLLTIMQVIFIGCLIVFFVLARSRAPIGLAFYLWLGIFNVMVVSNFWSFTNDLFDEHDGKRLFAIIGAGASIGAVVGAFVPHALHRTLGTYGLMMFAVVGLGVSVVLYRLVDIREHRRAGQADRPARHSEPAAAGKRGGFTLVMNDRYLRVLALMLLVATVINTSGEYVIGKMATDRSETYAAEHVRDRPTDTAASSDHPEAKKAAQDEYLSRFYSDYYGLVNMISALLEVLVVSRLLLTIGIRRALFIMPLIVLGGWVALIVFVNLSVVRIEKTTENSLDYSLHNTLRQALFLPTSAEAKYKAKAAIDTFFFRMGDVIAGIGIVFLFVHVLGLGVQAFAIMNACLALVWVGLAYRAGRTYEQLAAKSSRSP
jgi:ATP:ADP antiporter, AAA family